MEHSCQPGILIYLWRLGTEVWHWLALNPMEWHQRVETPATGFEIHLTVLLGEVHDTVHVPVLLNLLVCHRCCIALSLGWAQPRGSWDGGRRDLLVTCQPAGPVSRSISDGISITERTGHWSVCFSFLQDQEEAQAALSFHRELLPAHRLLQTARRLRCQQPAAQPGKLRTPSLSTV